jgi:small subunit ribosomal protein S3
MGQKVNPIGLRLGINRTWDSRWFARKGDYARLLHEDMHMREVLKKRLGQAGVSRIIIERPHKQCRVTIYAARPGVIIGKKGADIDKLRKDLSAMTDGDVALNIVEVRKPETDAQLVAENIAQQLERRVAFRRAMKRSLQSAMRLGAKGVRVEVAGRLGGAEIARGESYHEGRIPRHTLRADIDYGFCEAHTTYGIIGVKCWVFKGEVLEHDPMAQDKRLAGESGPAGEGPGRDRDRPDREPRGPRRDRGRGAEANA